jgi:hypothetical protein
LEFNTLGFKEVTKYKSNEMMIDEPKNADSDRFWLELHFDEEESAMENTLSNQNDVFEKLTKEDQFKQNKNTKNGLLKRKILEIQNDLYIYRTLWSFWIPFEFEMFMLCSILDLNYKGNDLKSKNFNVMSSYDKQMPKKIVSIDSVEINFWNIIEINRSLFALKDSFWRDEEYYYVRINNAFINFSDFKHDSMHFECLMDLFSNFSFKRINFDLSSQFSRNLTQMICNILPKWNVEWIMFKQAMFDFNTYFSFDTICTKMVCLCFEWCFYVEKGAEIEKDKKLIFPEIIFSKCLVKFTDDLIFHIHNPIINLLNTLNHQTINIDLSKKSNDNIKDWLSWRIFVDSTHCWQLKGIDKFKWRLRNEDQAASICSSLKELFSTPAKINKSIKFQSYKFDDFFLKKHRISVFLPHFTMNYNLECKEKMVLEVSTICMNMCEFFNLLQSIGWVSSWLLHACCLTFSIQHPWRSVLWSLDELYINNWFFYFIKDYKSVNAPKTTRNTLLAIELFLNQLMEIEFKNDFKLYFDDVNAYFNLWNVVLRHSWMNENLKENIKHIRRHISRSFAIKSRKYKGFKHKINMFSLTDIKNCIEIQRRTSLFLKNSKLYLWNWMITASMFILWISQSRHFTNLIFENCIIFIPEDVYLLPNTDFETIKFWEWWFIGDTSMLKSNYNEFYNRYFRHDLDLSYLEAAMQKRAIELLLKFKIWKEPEVLKMLTSFITQAQASTHIEFINCDFGNSSGSMREDSDYLEDTTLEMVFSIDEKYKIDSI